MINNRIGLIDFDFSAYKIDYFISQKGHTIESSMIDSSIDYLIINELTTLLETIFKNIDSNLCIFLFSCPTKFNYRKNISLSKEYKGNRGDTVSTKNIFIHYIKKVVMNYMKEFYHVLSFEDLEADDICSMLQCEYTFIYSYDKDLKQVKGFHYDIQNNELIYITAEESIQFLAKQLLSGDSTDNIPGINGIGEKAAEKIITDYKSNEVFFIVLLEYFKKYGVRNGIDSFTENYNLLSLRLNRGEYFKTKYQEAFILKNLLIEKYIKNDNHNT